jgi:hypothetical protein
MVARHAIEAKRVNYKALRLQERYRTLISTNYTSLRCSSLCSYVAREKIQKLASQIRQEFTEDAHMLVDIGLAVLDRDRPLVVEARREEDAAISKEEPVRV